MRAFRQLPFYTAHRKPEFAPISSKSLSSSIWHPMQSRSLSYTRLSRVVAKMTHSRTTHENPLQNILLLTIPGLTAAVQPYTKTFKAKPYFQHSPPYRTFLKQNISRQLGHGSWQSIATISSRSLLKNRFKIWRVQTPNIFSQHEHYSHTLQSANKISQLPL